MKISITYRPGEEQEATADLAALLHLHPGAKVKKSDVNPPYKHIYLTIKKSGKRCNYNENT